MLEVSESKVKEQQTQIAELGRRLNLALASKVQELARYRSEFFGRLREIIGERRDIRVVGDRFVFQSEVLFAPGNAELADAAKQQLDPVLAALKEIGDKIPPDINWVLRIDGRTVRLELGIVGGAGDLGRALCGLAGNPGQPPRRRRVCQQPAARPRRRRRALPAQPAHRAQADRALKLR